MRQVKLSLPEDVIEWFEECWKWSVRDDDLMQSHGEFKTLEEYISFIVTEVFREEKKDAIETVKEAERLGLFDRGSSV